MREFTAGKDSNKGESEAAGISRLEELVAGLQAERERMARNSQIPEEELMHLVFVAYSCMELSISKGCELLNCNIQEFQERWGQWIKGRAKMRKIFSGDLG